MHYIIGDNFSGIQIASEHQFLILLLTNHAELTSASSCHKSSTHVLVLFCASHSTFDGSRIISDLGSTCHIRLFLITEGEIQPMSTEKCQLHCQKCVQCHCSWKKNTFAISSYAKSSITSASTFCLQSYPQRDNDGNFNCA